MLHSANDTIKEVAIVVRFVVRCQQLRLTTASSTRACAAGGRPGAKAALAEVQGAEGGLPRGVCSWPAQIHNPMSSCPLLCEIEYSLWSPMGCNSTHVSTLLTALLQAKNKLANGKRLLESKKAELASQQGPLKCVLVPYLMLELELCFPAGRSCDQNILLSRSIHSQWLHHPPLCARERQQQRDAAAKTVRQEAAAAKRLDEVATNKYDETQEMVSSLAPLGNRLPTWCLTRNSLSVETVIKCQTYLVLSPCIGLTLGGADPLECK
jgi:hypothetical protein